ncbi:YD repeat-containing protein [Cyclobacterium lianum]|uniref:YD repeat-containing protein n=1 Tax=Cyclobacterium lianum TaxID=388280 RepID=A0A1M7NCR1_9BACT|nr:hypothetical protein [Cyclobacterium lianum]SHN01453.1 YD repeat-containing protein [Cyclobacterium lianum]
MRIRSWAMVIFCVSVCCQLRAQGPVELMRQLNPKFRQKTPNVAAMEKFGNYPVNLYTGLPDISISIFEITSGPLKVPIRLSYHASGIKYTDQASWVGLGWSLLGGGFISRNVHNKPDENSFLRNANDYSIASAPDCNNYEYKRLSVAIIDREADLFSYQLPGKSGKFYLRQTGAEPFLFPNVPLRVSHSQNLDEFEIVDENGIIYLFGKSSNDDQATEYITSGGTEGHVATWYLMEMRAPDTDDFISFSYQNVGKSYQQAVSNSMTLLDDCSFLPNNELDCPQMDTNIATLYTSTSSTQLGLSEIRFKTGMVKFVLGSKRLDQPGLNHLDRIEVYERTGENYQLIKQYEFDLDQYFQDRRLSKNYRLKLDAIRIKDGVNTMIGSHTFDYFTNYFSWDKPNNSYRIDNFGYFNNKPNADLIPPTEVDLTTGFTIPFGTADRNTDTTYLKEGVLKRITYPTGGYSEFEFEPHQYQILDKTYFAGGLRIKRIRRNTGSDTLVKNYVYGGNGPGAGFRNFILDDFLYSYTRYFKIGTQTSSLRYRSRVYYSSAVTGRGYEECPVVYPVVTEYESGEGNNGRTVYEFDDKLHIPDRVIGYPFGTSTKPFINSMAWARGKLTRKTVYDNNDEVLAQTSIQYKNYREDEQAVGQGVFQFVHQNGSMGYPYFEMCRENQVIYDAYEYIVSTQLQSTGIYRQTRIEESLFSPGQKNFTRLTEIEYDPEFLQVTKEKSWVVGSSLSTIQVNRYVTDFRNGGKNSTGEAFICHQIYQQNRLQVPIETYTVVIDGDQERERVVSGQINTYKEIYPGSDKYKKSLIYSLETASLLDLGSYSPAEFDTSGKLVIDEHYRPGLSLDQYDQSGNLVQMTRTAGRPISFLYGYAAALPVAIAENAAWPQVAFSSFEGKEKGGWSYTGDGLVPEAGTAKAGKKAYLLSKGPVSATADGAAENKVYKLSFWAKVASGVQTWSFMGQTEILDSQWTLIERTVTRPDISIIGDRIYIDELRLHPVDAQMTTFTHAPLRGLTSVMDIRNAAKYYEYDAYGRLASVRDQDGFLTEIYEYAYIIP